jgi:hypothetical protein
MEDEKEAITHITHHTSHITNHTSHITYHTHIHTHTSHKSEDVANSHPSESAVMVMAMSADGSALA